MRPRLLASIAIALILSAAGFYLAFRHVPFRDLWAYGERIDYLWLLPSLAATILCYVFRILRWQLILAPSQRVPFAAVYHAMMIGFAVNCVLPARAGEIARPLVLRKTHGVPFITALSTVAAERLFDLAAVLTLLIPALATVNPAAGHTVVFQGYALDSLLLARLTQGAWTGLGLLILGLALLAWPHSRRLLMRLVHRGVMILRPGKVGTPQRLVDRCLAGITRGVESAAQGLLCFQRPLLLAGVLGTTLLVWGLNIASLYLFSLGSPGIRLGPLEMGFVLVVICIFIALPSVPGYWGVWEAAGVFALSVYGTPAAEAAGFTLVSHALQILPVVLAGWYSGLRVGLRRSDLTLSRPQAPSPPA
jgi:uncharacterized membrane protein YbhN (UPF0104 family)